MRVYTHVPARSRTLAGLGRNPLVRRSDRIEAVIVLIAVGLTLFAAPLAGALGGAVHDVYAQTYAAQQQTRHAVPGIVTDNSATEARPYVVSTAVKASWLVGGIEHSGLVPWQGPTKAGQHIEVWLDASGHPVGPPTASSRAVVDGVLAGLAIWLGVIGALAVAVALARRWLNRGRRAGWDREIKALLDNGWGRSTTLW